jgi:uncharacterized protein involved in exopolysaccharide biosynthesis
VDVKRTSVESAPPVSQLEVKSLILSIIRRRWWVVTLTAASICAAGVLAFITAPIYRAETVLVRAESTNESSIVDAAASQLGGLASLAGFGENKNSSVIEAIAVLKSREFTDDFIRDRHLLPRLFHQRWDERAGKWRADAKEPNPWDGYKFFDHEIRRVDEDKKTGIVTLQIDWENPAEAADWANDLVHRLNAKMKTRALQETTTTLGYLTKELPKTDVASVQQALQKLIESNLKQQALANVRQEYVFRVIDPAAPPDPREKIRPRRALYLLAGAFFGLLVSMATIVGYDALRAVRSWLREPGAAN